MVACADRGTPKRPGGLGDFLAGSIGVHLAWASLSCEAEAVDRPMAVHAACVLLRRACLAAYTRNKRAMVAPDLLDELGPAFEGICPAEGAEGG